MTTLTDREIASLRAHHDQLAEVVARLTDDELVAPSAAAGWRICDVLSHLGSGAEITLAPVQAAVDGTPVPDRDNQAVWARWDAASPREQAEQYVEHDETLVGLLEGLSVEQRTATTVDLGFLPQPVPLEVAAGMRLNEVAAHAWDVQAGLDPAATLDAEAADVLLHLLAGALSFLLGFVAEPDAVSSETEVGAGEWGLVIDDGVRVIEAGSVPTATFTGAPEALVRLVEGRLGPDHTPPGIEVTGSVTLDDLRRVFPGF